MALVPHVRAFVLGANVGSTNMKPNAFIGKTKQPTRQELALALGPAHQLWEKLISDLELDQEWNSYSVKAGWSLKLKLKTRTILYLGPCDSCFRASFVLGDKALVAAQTSGLPKRILDLLSEAKKYPEGTAVRFENVKAGDVAAIMKLAAIKLAN